MIIAIDGPAASGKSTVARQVARSLGFAYLDTGAMYRAVAFAALDRGVPLDDERAVELLARVSLIDFAHEGDDPVPRKVYFDGHDVTAQIRTPAVDDAVSIVARVPGVRAAMVDQQRRLAAHADVVVEGRDIGSVVFPDAEVKVFLTASAQERARRRALDHADAGHAAEHAEVHAALTERDRKDSSRAASPLVRAPDAVEVDTTGLTLAEVVERVTGLAREAGAQPR